MIVNNIDSLGLSRKPKIEQAMDWLAEHGPLHENPALPPWILKHLVQSKRIARLRRGLYLAPNPRSGEMLPLLVLGARLAPEGYVSFYGALTLYDLTDQDAAVWGIVSRRRQAPIRYGRLRLRFIPKRKILKTAKTRRQRIGKWAVAIATPTQAFCDALDTPSLNPGWSELFHVLTVGLSTGKLTVDGLTARVLEADSIVLARRLGLLLELATGKVVRRLQRVAQRSHNWTRLSRAPGERAVRDSRWRLLLPRTRGELVGAARA